MLTAEEFPDGATVVAVGPEQLRAGAGLSALGDLGKGSIALRFTTTVRAPDGTSTSVPAIVGAFEDGDRLGLLTALADPAALAELLEQACQVRADALG